MLIVVDMQKDYDVGSNKALYGEVRSPYANPIASIVPAINRLRSSKRWARVVFTYDWLPAAMQRTFCRADSPGAALLDALDVQAGDVHFRKDNDDSFCTEGGVPEASTKCSQLGAVLAALGHSPQEASLVFAGQRFERCMLKTVMHARALGYECTICRGATYAKEEAPDPEWNVPSAEAIQLIMGPAAASEAGAPPAWAKEVHTARKSAGSRLATDYLQAANVRIVE